jgi:hypothetical protein
MRIEYSRVHSIAKSGLAIHHPKAFLHHNYSKDASGDENIKFITEVNHAGYRTISMEHKYIHFHLYNNTHEDEQQGFSP